MVAPNKVHHLFVAPCRRLWPDAHFHAAPGLEKKKPGLGFDAVLDDDTSAPWSDTIDQKLCRGMPYLNEVAFLHRASRTLVLTDLAFNLQWGENPWTRLWMHAMGIHERFAESGGTSGSWCETDRRCARRSMRFSPGTSIGWS